MTPQQKPPRVVAELGRPETPQETAARKAEDSRRYRSRKTVSNLVYALLATLALVLIIVLVVPRSDTSLLPDVDYHSAAAHAQEARDEVILDPVLPEGWTSNSATLSVVDEPSISDWYIGLLTPDEQFIGIRQGFDANATWQAQQLEGALADTTVTIDDVTWTVYDNRDAQGPDDPGNIEYALATEAGTSTILIYGTATVDDFHTVAEAVADQVVANETAKKGNG